MWSQYLTGSHSKQESIMAETYSEEIVYTSSKDGYLLEGVLMRPMGATPHPVSVVWIHGNASRFYDYPYVVIGRALAEAGYPFISANTRGHDISAFMWRASEGRPLPWSSPAQMPVGMGSGWEQLEEAPRDLAAWVGMAADAGAGSMVLVGHSSGAQRVVLYQAERQDERVAGIALASPDLRGFMPPGELEEAKRMVAEGRGLEVLPAQPFAPWYRQSAQAVVARAASLAHLLASEGGAPMIAAIRCPMLAFYGGREPGGTDTVEVIRQQAQAARVETRLIEDADHIYWGHESEVATVLARWMAELT
jgi:hypothetical protein